MTELQTSRIVDAYLRHLTTTDMALLAGQSANQDRDNLATHWRSNPGRLQQTLADPRVRQAVLQPTHDDVALVSISPFLVFAVAVHSSALELERAGYVSEWLGPRQRLPVFDVVVLRQFLADAWRRYFLVELLASYTHVASGSLLVATRRGWRRHRFSELDPVRLAGLIDLVSDAERPGIYRRLGDLALFLTGVFPDYVARKGFAPLDEGRLLRAGSATSGRKSVPGQVALATGEGRPVGLLQILGQRWYQIAYDLVPRPVSADVAVLAELSGRFDQARRILNVVTERFLFQYRDRWFGQA